MRRRDENQQTLTVSTPSSRHGFACGSHCHRVVEGDWCKKHEEGVHDSPPVSTAADEAGYHFLSFSSTINQLTTGCPLTLRQSQPQMHSSEGRDCCWLTSAEAAQANTAACRQSHITPTQQTSLQLIRDHSNALKPFALLSQPSPATLPRFSRFQHPSLALLI
ncbi:hypothetical protein BLNAU_14606 [Blattamonas nauphoetae]|uniref:Uncharacterized protein n=1 Tax=Blattamonas nauphoetae TaxID=2049346 RepID=A0ABQ9XDA9_9EUKA|nr:hypothetical protein BLNAU_14606 [Blattamonas nauphoetae]